MTYVPMTDKEWQRHKEWGLLERDGSVYGCTLCGKQIWSAFLNPWPFRCWDCDPDNEWSRTHYDAFDAGYEKGLKDGMKSRPRVPPPNKALAITPDDSQKSVENFEK